MGIPSRYILQCWKNGLNKTFPSVAILFSDSSIIPRLLSRPSSPSFFVSLLSLSLTLPLARGRSLLLSSVSPSLSPTSPSFLIVLSFLRTYSTYVQLYVVDRFDVVCILYLEQIYDTRTSFSLIVSSSNVQRSILPADLSLSLFRSPPPP